MINRRQFIQGLAYSTTALTTAALYRYFRGGQSASGQSLISNDDGVTPEDLYRLKKKFLNKSIHDFSKATTSELENLTSYKSITNYNNFYEFSTDKEAVAKASQNWKIPDWSLEVGGLVEKPLKLNLNDIRRIKSEDRIYRFRCVEGWSMVIPWTGFVLARLLEQVRPLPAASYVAFESYYNEEDMPNATSSGITFPYKEGLRLDEALHPLTFMATGLYNRNLPNQNGAPVRLVVPWKYGFKSAKSIIKINLVDHEPSTTWNLANPKEYGFYSNVNPEVDHPRWSQKQERRIGEYKLRETLMFNGYAKEVEQLYAGLDLRKNF